MTPISEHWGGLRARIDTSVGGSALDLVLLLIAGFLALANLTDDLVPDGARQPDIGAVVIAVAMVLAVLLRRVSPIGFLAVSSLAWIALSLAPYPPVLPIVPIVAVFFLAVSGGESVAEGVRWPEIAGAVCGLALLAPVALVDAPPRAEVEFHVAYLLSAALAWIVGERLGQRRVRAYAREEAAVIADRERLAREIHDSVGHTISAIAVSAGAARLNLESDPSAAGAAISRIESTARQAAAELDVLLGDLDGPLPDADDIPALVVDRRTQGQRIDAEIDPLKNIDPAVGRALFRITQESLTNASRHAPEAKVRLSITEAKGRVSLMITSEAGSPDLIVGRGISGMIARAHGVGGELVVDAEQGRVVVSGHLPSGGAS